MSHDKRVYIITGPCGVGKTTILPFIRDALPEFDVHDFDEVGVPDHPTIEWRKETTKYWIDYSINNLQSNVSTIILGMISPLEFAEYVPDALISCLRFLLLEVSLEERDRRFKCRNEQREIILKERVNLDNLRSWLEIAPFEYDVIDTTNLTIEETVERALKWIKTNSGPIPKIPHRRDNHG